MATNRVRVRAGATRLRGRLGDGAAQNERIWVVLCGGPGKFDPKDKEEHDRGWSNYVDHLLLMARNKKLPAAPGEKVWWIVYRPAYDARWRDDVSRGAPSVSDVKGKGLSSYVDLMTKRAA